MLIKSSDFQIMGSSSITGIKFCLCVSSDKLLWTDSNKRRFINLRQALERIFGHDDMLLKLNYIIEILIDRMNAKSYSRNVASMQDPITDSRSGVPVLLFSGGQQLMHLLEFVLVLTY